MFARIRVIGHNKDKRAVAYTGIAGSNKHLYHGLTVSHIVLHSQLLETLQDLVVQLVPERVGVSTGPLLYAILGAIGIILLIALFVTFMTDLLMDAWKVPIALFVDLIKYGVFLHDYAGYAAGVIGAIVFVSISDAQYFTVPFALISVAAGIATVHLSGTIGLIAVLVPVNTGLMLISTVID